MGRKCNTNLVGDNEEDEVDPISGLTYKIIGEAMGADDVLQPRRSTRNVGVRELDEEDFVSEDDGMSRMILKRKRTCGF